MASQISIELREFAALVVREYGLKEGHWGIWVGFGIGAVNAGPDPEHLQPAAVVPITQLGIQRFDEPNNMTVDAAEIFRGASLPPGARERVAVGRPVPKATPKPKKRTRH